MCIYIFLFYFVLTLFLLYFIVMPRTKLSLSQKVEIVEAAQASGNIRQTARKYKVQPSQIRCWRTNVQERTHLAEQNPSRLNVHKGRKILDLNIEQAVYTWIIAQRNAELAVSTLDIINNAMSIDANFRDGNRVRLIRWVHDFTKRRRLCVRVRTHNSQITNEAMQSVKQDYNRRIMKSFDTHIRDPHYLVNMDETAVYLNCCPSRTVHQKGGKRVSIMIGGTSSRRFTLGITLAMDGAKLPLFVILKGLPGGRIEKSLTSELPEGLVGCVQRKGWMDNRTIDLWYERVFKPYVSGCTERSGLLLDDFKCHRNSELVTKMDEANADRYMIPPHYTGLLQPCDVGINKPLKDRPKEKVSDWRRKKHENLRPGQLLPSPTRKNIAEWPEEIWQQFPVQIVKNSFRGSGYFFKDTIDYSGETESESDADV